MLFANNSIIGMESIAINAPGDNARGMHTYKLRIKAGYNLLTAFSKGIDATTYLDPSWLPGRQDGARS